MATSLKSLRANSITPVIVTAGVSSGVKITSVTPSVGLLAGGQTVTVAGSGFSSGAVVYVDSNTCSTTYVSSTSLTFTSPAKNLGAYHLYVYNTDGSVGVKPNGITYSTAPSWVTASGALTGAVVGSSYSQSVNATSDSTITYSVTSGSLPTGLSLNSSNGQISGTTTTAATSNFTITATDSENQTTSRSFSIESTNVIIADYLVIGAGGGGGRYGGGGGAGGLLSATSVYLTPSVTYTVTIGAGGTVGDNIAGTNGGNTSISGSGFSTVTAIGGGGGAAGDTPGAAGNGGSGGGGSQGGNSGGKGVYPGSSYLSQSRQGYDGGSWSTNNNYMAGGGGAGAAGVSPSGAGAAGGIGVASSITGSSVYYAGGGGGGGWIGEGAGGTGGGGKGGAYNVVPVAGTVNTGGGGGGGGYDSNYRAGATGGSGVVILKINGSTGNVSTTGTPPDMTVGSGYTVYKFTGSGSITFN